MLKVLLCCFCDKLKFAAAAFELIHQNVQASLECCVVFKVEFFNIQ